MTESTNPYQAPNTTSEGANALGNVFVLKQTTFKQALFRWVLICAVSATPSFIGGLVLTNGSIVGIGAMLAGVLLFSLAYACADVQPVWRRWMTRRPSRWAIMTSFGIRIAVSVLLPLGFIHDAYLGSVSMRIGFDSGFDSPMNPDSMGFAPTFLTTIVQGLFLNIEVGCLALLVYAIARAVLK